MRHRNEPGKYEIGTFEVQSGKLMVSDPCYQGGGDVLENVKNGTWEASIRLSNEGSWGDRVAELYVRCGGTHDEPWRRTSFTVGVDAGQVCIVDLPHFSGGDGEWDDHESFYGDACDKSMEGSVDGLGAGILKSGHGVNSSSGYGDGSYRCYYGEDRDGKITSVRVVFIEEEARCEECGANPDGGDWSEEDMVDGQCPSCRGRVFCQSCYQWCRDDEMYDDETCDDCAPEEEEEEEEKNAV